MNETIWPDALPGTIATGTCQTVYAVFEGYSPNPSLVPQQPCLLSGDETAAFWGSPTYVCERKMILFFPPFLPSSLPFLSKKFHFFF